MHGYRLESDDGSAADGSAREDAPIDASTTTCVVLAVPVLARLQGLCAPACCLYARIVHGYRLESDDGSSAD